MICLGIDPDTKNIGLAVVEFTAATAQTRKPGFEVLRVLTAGAKGTTVQDRLVELGKELHRAIVGLRVCSLDRARYDRVAIEWQALRPRGERNPNSIVDLNGVAGMCLQAVLSGVTTDVYLTPTPPQWKGQVDKDIQQRRILSALGLTEDLRGVSGSETMTQTQKGHVITAIGLACWAGEQRLRNAA